MRGVTRCRVVNKVKGEPRGNREARRCKISSATEGLVSEKTNLSSIPVGPPPTTTFKHRQCPTSNINDLKNTPYEVNDQPPPDFVQGTRLFPRLLNKPQKTINIRIHDISIPLDQIENYVQSINCLCILSASDNSFMKHAFSFTPGIPNVCVSAPTA
jgi:hypothetical protein